MEKEHIRCVCGRSSIRGQLGHWSVEIIWLIAHGENQCRDRSRVCPSSRGGLGGRAVCIHTRVAGGCVIKGPREAAGVGNRPGPKVHRPYILAEETGA